MANTRGLEKVKVVVDRSKRRVCRHVILKVGNEQTASVIYGGLDFGKAQACQE